MKELVLFNGAAKIISAGLSKFGLFTITALTILVYAVTATLLKKKKI